MDDATIRLMQLSQKGYNCSQIILMMGLEVKNEENPGLVRAVSGLAYGCGDGRGTCGVLTGGCCLIGLFAGKGGDDETPSDRLMLMLTELSEWFSDMFGNRDMGVSCQGIVGEDGPAASRQLCGEMVSKTYAKAMEILMTNDIDPSEG